MTWKGPLTKIDRYRFEIPASYKGEHNNLEMKTSAVLYINESMVAQVRMDNAPEQAVNVTMLPGIVGKSLAMPDIHWGYGFPIGGVAATDADDGVISPGGVGFDINCGVRLVRTNLHFNDLSKSSIQQLVDQMFINVPSGLGSKAKVHLNRNQLHDVLIHGAKWAIENGYGWDEDARFLEENGCLKTADYSTISDKAKQRGAPQLGSLGAGNHFLEIQKVAEIFDKSAADSFGIKEIGQIMVMIHTGSRGFGHQVCTDHLQVLEQAVKKYGIWLPDRQLACAPIHSKEGQNYLKAMACAANFAWCNRQMIVHWIRESFEKILQTSSDELDMGIVYDVCHNIAKLEEHTIDGKKRKVYVHRKGATRSFGPDRSEIPEKYRDIGQPVIIPGDMGSESYLLKGTNESEETFGSTCHGAGRVMSRHQAIRNWRGEQIMALLNAKGIYAHPASLKVLAEEAPEAYKDVSEVVNVTDGAGISKKVVKLVPLGVVKG
ncbi:MAG: RtcB family protein [Candidatus Thermoplasmatota archaeon]|nr:RtcB family protein [Candidatus Thermoplasmatota archaeon]MBU1941995.1 RtcB family protein [Candidatus Thermoplasmatota archaeon]